MSTLFTGVMRYFSARERVRMPRETTDPRSQIGDRAS
jgi:hypothetical protein